MASFSSWLRENSQTALLSDAQRKVAKSHGLTIPPQKSPLFWRLVFVPAYRFLPWAVRRQVMAAMPGSHRRSWPKQSHTTGPAV
jgi:hypothetical protein